MEPLSIKSTEDTPKIVLDPFKGLFEISGRSLPEDVNHFYKPVIDWLVKYFENPNPKTTLTINLQYFNTASSKILVEIFSMADNKFEDGYDVEVKWYAQEDDEDIIEAGEEFSENIRVPFQIIIVNE